MHPLTSARSIGAVAAAVLLSIAIVWAADTHGRGPLTVARTSGVITVGGTPHPYVTEGTGLSCIIVGIAPPWPPLFSDRLKQHIRFIAVDHKNTWLAETPRNIDAITMETLVNEIDEVRRAFSLEKACLIAHSTPGLVALEYALRHPQHVSHLVAVGMPPFYNAEFRKMQASFWESDASPERKAVKRKLDERLSDATLLSLSPRDTFAMRYVRNGPRYFYDPSYDFAGAWLGRHFSIELLTRFFNVILPEHDARPKLSTIGVPMILVLGRYDYAVPYEVWNGLKERIPKLSYHLFDRSSHFPMIDEPARFDDTLTQWITASPRP